MKVLLLLSLPLFVFGVVSPAEALNNSKHGKQDRIEAMSESQKLEWFKEWKVDPEVRKARLEIIKSKLGRKLKETQTDQEKERLTNIIQKNKCRNKGESLDIAEINERVGVAPYLFDGDIYLTEEQLNHIERMSEETRVKRQMTRLEKRWPGNTVYYYFDESIDDNKRDLVHKAHSYLQSHTCINFEENSTAVNRVKVYNGGGCWSYIGMGGGEQQLSFGDYCTFMEAIAHEFIHALGSYHTQARSDRDEYVTIDTDVVQSGHEGNFWKIAGDRSYTPYDYASVMHYKADSWVKEEGQLSIIPKDERYLYAMGSGQFSFYDIEMINEHYGCAAACIPQNSANCQNGGVPNPRNCSICNCPRGYGGALCDQRPPGCGSDLQAADYWQRERLSMGTLPNYQKTLNFCNIWITAPPGKQIEVQIVSIEDEDCQYGCMYKGIEIKTDANQKNTNPIYCCKDSLVGKTFKSSLNPMPIISYLRTSYFAFTFHYRYVDGPTPSTTPKPAPNSNCRDTTPTDFCEILKASGHCDPKKDFSTMKYYCGKTCGFCGKAADPCVDNNNCAQILKNGGCSSIDPMEAEYKCAKTCGYCEHPN